jgi:hypothetical protein
MNELGSIPSFVKRAAQQTGFERERYIEAKIPDDFSRIVVICFFGDYRAEAILSSLILHSYIKKHLSDKYVILCSWQGHAGLYPYVDEYWSLGEQMTLADLHFKANGFDNQHKNFEIICRNLRKFFDVLTWEDIGCYYDCGLTKSFFEQVGDPIRFYPGIPAPKIEFLRELQQRNKNSIFIYPRKQLKTWNKRDLEVSVDYDWWNKLTENLLNFGLLPVVYQNYSTYDISKDFGDKCLYVTDNNISSVLSQMRATGLVLDVFSGISRLAMLARCPFIVLDERKRYVLSKEYEINDLCINVPYRYILSFGSLLQHRNYNEVISHIMNVIKEFNVNKSQMPTSLESFTPMSYKAVRTHKEKKFGMRFIKVEKLVI